MGRRLALTGTMVVATWLLLVNPGAAQQPVTCSANCAQLQVKPDPPSGGNVPVEIVFTQGPDDGQAGQGNDETAALAFTLGMPGSGGTPPLTLADCTINSDGLTSAITVADAIKSTFKVVIENLSCTTTSGSARTRCLCPDAGQQRDDFINVVVYGPKDLPTSGPVTIPVLPTGTLVTFNLHQDSTAKTNLHVFAETDDQTTYAKPQFGAFLSIGDKSAIDQTFDRTVSPNKGKITITNASVGSSPCVGDCDLGGSVSVDELVKGVNIALGNALVTTCSAFDFNGDNKVTVDELVKGVNNALNGCQ